MLAGGWTKLNKLTCKNAGSRWPVLTSARSSAEGIVNCIVTSRGLLVEFLELND